LIKQRKRLSGNKGTITNPNSYQNCGGVTQQRRRRLSARRRTTPEPRNPG